MNRIKRPVRFRIVQIVVYALFSLMAVGVIYPVLWTLFNSLKPTSEFYSNNFGLPGFPLMWENYATAWSRGIGTYYVNSIVVTVVTVVLSTLIAAMAAYGIARFRFAGRGTIFYYVVGGLLVSQQVATISLFKLLKAVSLYDTIWGLILPYIAFRIPFSVFLVYSYFLSFPREIEEAATIDGCNSWGIFFRMILPISKPILASCAIMAAMFAWNEYTFALIFVESQSLYTIPIGLAAFKDALYTDWAPILAGVIITTLPMFLFFIALQRYFVAGLTAGSTKG